MPYLVIAIIFIIILSVIFSSFMPKIKTKKAYDELLSYLKQTDLNYSIEKIKNDIFDAKLNINSTHYYIKFLNIPAYSEIQVNNKTTWELKYGAKDQPGKAQPHKRYLSELSSFLGTDFGKNINKIIIVFPKPKKIVKYINESEIIFVNSKTDLYGTRILTKDNFGLFKK